MERRYLRGMQHAIGMPGAGPSVCRLNVQHGALAALLEIRSQADTLVA
jgi:hypothetical protein